MYTDTQVDTISSTDVVPLTIELRDPFGAVIARWELQESHGESGGAFTLAAIMKSQEVKSFAVPFTQPGGDARAQYYFHLSIE